jgi:hypothetical protein
LQTDPWAAGVEAVDSALDGRTARFIMLFACAGYSGPELLAGVADRAPEAEVIGCTVPSHISCDGPGEAGVLVLALGGPGFRASTAAASSEDGPRAAGQLGAEGLKRTDDPAVRELVMLLTASQAGDQNEIIRGAYGVLGAGLPLVGGCTSQDSSSASASCQFHGRDVLQDAVVAASLMTDGPVGIGVRHGLSRIGEPMTVSRSDGGRVLELDGRPALDAYLEMLQAPPEAARDAEAFTNFALAHPLGLSRSSGPDQARCIGAADFEERSLLCVAEVPQGSPCWLLHEDARTTISAAVRACQEAVGDLGGATPRAVVVFDCIGRRKLLGDDGTREEVAALNTAAAGAPLAGFYTHGEIARTHGLRGFHNKTVVVLALG